VLFNDCVLLLVHNKKKIKENHGTRRRQFHSLRATWGKTPPCGPPAAGTRVGWRGGGDGVNTCLYSYTMHTIQVMKIYARKATQSNQCYNFTQETQQLTNHITAHCILLCNTFSALGWWHCEQVFLAFSCNLALRDEVSTSRSQDRLVETCFDCLGLVCVSLQSLKKRSCLQIPDC